jgi:hypothetical protein
MAVGKGTRDEVVVPTRAAAQGGRSCGVVAFGEGTTGQGRREGVAMVVAREGRAVGEGEDKSHGAAAASPWFDFDGDGIWEESRCTCLAGNI